MDARGDVRVERRADGCTLLSRAAPLPASRSRVTDPLLDWAAATPGATFLAEPGPEGWRRLSYADALAHTRRIAAGLLRRGLSAERPVLILSGNGIDHALLALACLHIGIPYAPVSVAYSLASDDLGKLRRIVALTTPGLIFATGPGFGRALDAVAGDAEILHDLASLAADPTPAVSAAAAAVGPDTIAKLLFTSGSTGTPKAVINTHRMLCANQAMLAWRFGFLRHEPPVLVDWLPWSHTFGGNHNVNLVLFNGGTLYIDAGRPLPGQFGPTLQALRDIAPTMHLAVPKAWEELARHLRADPAFNRHFHSRLRVPFYAAAALPQPVWDELKALSREATGRVIPMITGLGSTETAPMALCIEDGEAQAGDIGLPMPGLELKLAPNQGKLELCIRGPSITPGYWRNAETTAAAIDAEGFLRMGDAVTWVDPAEPARGLRFDGRLAEDFKLSSGTWVSVGPLRARLIAALAPHVRDVVITGHGRDWLGALALPNDPAAASDPAIRAHIAGVLADLAAQAPGSSARVERLAFLTARLSIDAGEVTDKGSVNQAAVLRCRAQAVAELYRDPPPDHVLCARPALVAA